MNRIVKVLFSDFDHSKFLTEVMKVCGSTTEASCFINEKVMHILQLDTK